MLSWNTGLSGQAMAIGVTLNTLLDRLAASVPVLSAGAARNRTRLSPAT